MYVDDGMNGIKDRLTAQLPVAYFTLHSALILNKMVRQSFKMVHLYHVYYKRVSVGTSLHS